jgi:hypothetical protein
MRLKFWSAVAAVLALVAGLVAADESALRSALEAITTRATEDEVKYLSSAELGGRLAGSPEGRQAAAHIAQAFRDAGLRPLGPDGSFFQEFVRSRQTTDPASRLRIVAGRPENGVSPLDVCSLGSDPIFRPAGAASRPAIDLAPLKGFAAFPFSAAGQVKAEIVFVGYGITAPEERYDDYAGVDVRGKAVLVLRHEPLRAAATQAFAGRRDTPHSLFTAKALNAQQHGAAAVLLTSDPVNHPNETDTLIADLAPGRADVAIPVVQITLRAATDLVAACGRDLAQVQQEIDRTLAPRSFPLAGAAAALDLKMAEQRLRLQNVVALLPGSDPQLAEQCVLIGAHYDHLGRGEYGGGAGGARGLFPGADDNASGAAALIQIARALGPARTTSQPAERLCLRRGVVFAAFDGEEIGLLGSRYYAEHPPVPLDRTVAMINLDMIGRAKPGQVAVLGVDSAAGFREMLSRLAQDGDVTLRPAVGSDLGGSSDHEVFHARGIPTLFFFGAMHRDYHSPRDTWEKVDGANLSHVARLALLVTRELADQAARPTFVPPKPR